MIIKVKFKNQFLKNKKDKKIVTIRNKKLENRRSKTIFPLNCLIFATVFLIRNVYSSGTIPSKMNKEIIN